MRKLVGCLAIAALWLVGPVVGAAPPAPQASATGWTLIGWNNLGMHCMDADFSVFSILPPYNSIHAQLIDPSGLLVTNPSARGVTVTYQAVADPTLSINKTSAGKSNFWQWAKALFGVDLPVDQGLAGNPMPGPANTPQPMPFDPDSGWFVALGIPITPTDDALATNAYPLMRLVAKDSAGNVLATTDIVLPVSAEMDCRACHASGSAPAARPTEGWAWNADSQRDYRLNILLLHDDRHRDTPLYGSALGAAGYSPRGLYASATTGTPVLCAACHLSEALPGTGQAGVPPLTASVHSLHAAVTDPTNGLILNASANRSACYRCHPGSTTKCLRGAMGSAVAADGSMAMQCQGCHGSMSDVGAATRTGWLEEPSCQNCHTGTAVTNSGQIRYTSAFASPGVLRTATDGTFATNANTPGPDLSLYRFSFGHGSLACESCHGSTHAEYPSSHANDNIQSQNIQAHAGTLVECASCHVTSPTTVNQGPHGMHPIGQQWVSDHHDAIVNEDTTPCQACHGTNYRGSVLSYAKNGRTFSTPFGTKTFWRGSKIGCYNCHNGPHSESANPNIAPVASNASASTTSGTSAPVGLVATDANGNPLTIRIVSQPTHGTAALSGTTATYLSEPAFVGTDTFTFAANDGSTDSNLATVTVTVSPSPCTLTCDGVVPASGVAGSPVGFSGSAVASGCGAPVAYAWDFGDGSPAATTQSPTHAYGSMDTFRWTMTATAGGTTCTDAGTLRATGSTPLPVPSLLQPLRVATGNHGNDLTLSWDPSNCPSGGYHVVYGYGSRLPSFGVAGGVCTLGTSGSTVWASSPDPGSDSSHLLWFVLVGDDGASTEGSWGATSSNAERGGSSASAVCGMLAKQTSGYCAAP